MIKFKINGYEPIKSTKYSAGYDLRASLNGKAVTLAPGDRTLIPTGITVEMPNHMTGLICPRSGLALNRGLTVLNAPGVIDPDYTGEIGVIIVNQSKYAQTIACGDKIAQIIFTFNPISQDEGQDVERGSNGFGSTGE